MPRAPRSEKAADKIISVRLTGRERSVLEEYQQRSGQTASEVVRQAVAMLAHDVQHRVNWEVILHAIGLEIVVLDASGQIVHQTPGTNALISRWFRGDTLALDLFREYRALAQVRFESSDGTRTLMLEIAGCGPQDVAMLLRESTSRAAKPPTTVDAEYARLPKRRLEIANLLASTALSYKEIAAKLGISEGTLRAHVERLYRELRVGSRAELAHVIRR